MSISDRDALELDLVLDKVSDFASFDLAKEAIRHEEVDFNPLAIKRKLSLSKEAQAIILSHGRIDLSDVKDISSLLATLDKGLSLTSLELLMILEHNAQIKRVKRFFKDLEEVDDLEDFLSDLYFDDGIMNIITLSIDPNGKIKDEASPKLKELRHTYAINEKRLGDASQEFLRKHSNSLQEGVVYNRHDRACFLIKNADKNKFEGFFHGESASGLATYVEPKVLIDLNNQKNELILKMQDEEERILLELSLKVAQKANLFKNNLESLTELEKALAKADYGIQNNGVLAAIGSKLSLEEIAHPLIDPSKVVSNSYHLGEGIHGIVISGSNTGGKTVSMKTIALAVLLSYLGIPLLAKEAIIPIYSKVLVDIDDVQSLVDSLSTFSSRLVKLKTILNSIDDKSLVLIDEIASGTDPKEGEALALAILDELKKSGAYFVITTHFSRLKEYALTDQNLLIASQSFDLKNMKPTYEYLENVLGYSNALDIASNYLENEEVINRARQYYEENANEAQRALKSLELKELEIKDKELEVEALKVEVSTLKKELEERLKELEDSKAELLKQAQEEYMRYVNKQKARLGNLIKKAQDNAKELEKIEKELVIEEDVPIKEVHEFKVGDKAKIISTSQVGEIISIKKGEARLNVGGLTLSTATKDLEYVASYKPAKIKKLHEERSFKRAEKELKLIGLHVNEALELLDAYLTKAYGANMKQVKIVHGIGTLALKKAVISHLKQSKLVKSFKDADHYDGGAGATVVELK